MQVQGHDALTDRPRLAAPETACVCNPSNCCAMRVTLPVAGQAPGKVKTAAGLTARLSGALVRLNRFISNL